MNRFIMPWIMLLAVFLLFPNVSLAAGPVHMMIDGQRLSSDVSPVIYNDRTLVPVRVISERLGAKVEWNDRKRQVTIVKQDKRLLLTIDSPRVLVNGHRVDLDVPALLLGDRTMLPFRFIGEQLGAEVRWDDSSRTVIMTSPKPLPQPPPQPPLQPLPEPSVKPSDPEPSVKPTDKAETPIVDPAKPGEADKPVAALDNSSTEPAKPVASMNKLLSINAKDNRITLQVSGDPSIRSFSLKSPRRLVIDLLRTELEPFEQLTEVSSSLISSVRYSLFTKNPATVRVVIDLNFRSVYQIKKILYKNEIIIDLQPNPFIVVIDPGHGGKDPGGIGITAHREKDYALSQSLKIMELLEREPEIKPVMTRDDDRFLELWERVEIANSIPADLFISVHANKIGNPEIQGSEVFYKHDNSISLASALQRSLLEAVQSPDRGVKSGNFFVIRETTMPAALLEVGFLSNAAEEAKLFTPSLQDEVALKVVKALKQYLKENVD